MTPASREALLLMVLGAALGLGSNAVRGDRLPLSGPLGDPSPPEAGASLPATEPAAAVDAWQRGAFFLDVRSPDEFERHRVAGALPLPAETLEDAYFRGAANLPPEMPLVVYGAGPDSFAVRRVAQYLIDVGHQDVACVVTGLESLLEAGADAGDGPAEALW